VEKNEFRGVNLRTGFHTFVDLMRGSTDGMLFNNFIFSGALNGLGLAIARSLLLSTDLIAGGTKTCCPADCCADAAGGICKPFKANCIVIKKTTREIRVARFLYWLNMIILLWIDEEC
jgi:hypothetical protein